MKSPIKFIIKYIFSSLILAIFVFSLSHCNRSEVVTSPYGHDTGPTTTYLPETTEVFWGATFHPADPGAYKTLLKACRRCGKKRVENYGGHVVYQKHFLLPSDSPLDCDNWAAEGYIQIKFQAKKLPTEVEVTILPKYTSSSTQSFYTSNAENNTYGRSFTVKSTAYAINENEGFQIDLSPSQGLGGVRVLRIESLGDNHVTNSTNNLDIQAFYQNTSNTDEGDEVALEVTLSKLKKRAVQESQFTCAQYTY